MKRFDSAAIKARMIERLRISEEWALLLGDGTFGNLIDTIAEGRAEDARYMEYLLGEKKWKTAMNLSSLQSMADLIGYKRQLPQSSTGYIIVSHTDIEGVDRLANYGTYFFDINAASNYDNIEKSSKYTTSESKALVPWTCDDTYTIPKGTIFTSSSGVQFISTAAVTSRPLKKAWSTISTDSSLLETFYSEGGWNGIKYLKVPVIQGIQRSVSIGTTSASRFETFTLSALNIENASNNISCGYFKVHCVYNNVDTVYAEIDNICRAGPYDKVFEKSILKDGTGIKIKFGDGVTGQIPTSGSIVKLDYLETLGKDGNIDSKYQVTTMAASNDYAIDPRTGKASTFLYCTNIVPLQGGKNIEDIDDFRKNAPASYMKSYTIATNASYLDTIEKYSPLNLLHVKIYPDSAFTSTQIDSSTTNYTEEVANEISTIKSNLNITALLANGTAISASDADDEFIQPLLLSMGDIKGPNDSLTYVAPNLIEIAPSVKIRSSDTSTTESDMADLVSTAWTDEYDIYNQDFNEELYKSKLVELAKVFPFSDSVNVMTEAVADVDIDDTVLLNKSTSGSTSLSDVLVAIPFSFDSLYSTDKYNLGFKNCTSNADYLLKVDLSFNNSSDHSGLTRTFFLYDNRTDESGDTTLQAAKSLKVNSTGDEPIVKRTIVNSEIGTVKFFDETKDGFDNRQVRVAQFPFISKMTDSEYMTKVKSYELSPLENRPYVIDTTGKNKTFTSTMVDTSLQVSLAGEDATVGTICYKRNSDYIDYVDIVFNETYSDTTAATSANGYFIIPWSYLNYTISSTSSSSSTAFSEIVEQLNSHLNLRIYAQPKMENFEPENYNDIIYINKDYIKVEKDIKY